MAERNAPGPALATTPSVVGTLAEAIAREVRAHRVLDASLAAGALVLEVTRPDGSAEAWSIAVDGREAWVMPGGGGLPAAPRATLSCSEADLLDLVRGTQPADALLRDGRLRLAGSAPVLQAFAACLQPGESWLSVRLRGG